MIYSPDDFPIEKIREIPNQRPGVKLNKSRRRIYKDLICAFDIETTTVQVGDLPPILGRERPNLQAFMYVWMLQLGPEITVIGHYWPEFLDVLERIAEGLREDEYIVLAVHNLSFEFQFLRGIYPFTNEEIFALRSRKILRCDMMEHFEFRCSYVHSNLDLAHYLKKWGVKHQKKSGEIYDYSKIRYPWTPADPYEQEYQVNDVLGLVEAITAEMQHDGDNLYTSPMTSTGYVRRIVKKRMRDFPYWRVARTLPDLATFYMLTEAFRGGNTHANRYYAGMILYNLESWDYSSSYPAVLLNCQYPMGPWQTEPAIRSLGLHYCIELMEKRHRALLLRVRFHGLKLRDKLWGCPYLTKAKGRNVINAEYDNGRILAAEWYETTITDVDLRIILDEYDWHDVEVLDLRHALYDYLPEPIREAVREFYHGKTELKFKNPTPEQELIYQKYKGLINAIYGMMVENPLKPEQVYNPEDPRVFVEELGDPEEKLKKSQKNAFRSYAWGVWCTAWARYRLEQVIRIVGNDFGYCDTDSVKFLAGPGHKDHRPELEALNEELRDLSIKTGGHATDPKGKEHYLGVLEYEETYRRFLTHGAKKYCYTVSNGVKEDLHITIAGVGKIKGARELWQAGGLRRLQYAIDHPAHPYTFRIAGGTESIYNDQLEPVLYEAEGREIPITSNVVIKDSTYTYGITADYERLLSKPDIWLDIITDWRYNNEVADAAAEQVFSSQEMNE